MYKKSKREKGGKRDRLITLDTSPNNKINNLASRNE
jgi:hypothetical protein